MVGLPSIILKSARNISRDCFGDRLVLCVCVCVCVCFSSKSAFPLYLKVLYDMLGSQRCSRDCSGVLVVASLEETQGLLSRFDSVYSGYITRGGAGVDWWVAMSLRARCFFFPTHDVITSQVTGHRSQVTGHRCLSCVSSPEPLSLKGKNLPRSRQRPD